MERWLLRQLELACILAMGCAECLGSEWRRQAWNDSAGRDLSRLPGAWARPGASAPSGAASQPSTHAAIGATQRVGGEDPDKERGAQRDRNGAVSCGRGATYSCLNHPVAPADGSRSPVCPSSSRRPERDRAVSGKRMDGIAKPRE